MLWIIWHCTQAEHVINTILLALFFTSFSVVDGNVLFKIAGIPTSLYNHSLQIFYDALRFFLYSMWYIPVFITLPSELWCVSDVLLWYDQSGCGVMCSPDNVFQTNTLSIFSWVEPCQFFVIVLLGKPVEAHWFSQWW